MTRRAADLQTIAASKLDRADANLLAAVAAGWRRELRIAPDAGAVECAGASPGEATRIRRSGPALTIERARGGAQAHRGSRAGAGRRRAMTAPAAAPVSGAIVAPTPRAGAAGRDRPLRIRRHARLASRRGGESGLFGRGGRVADFERAEAGTVAVRTAGRPSDAGPTARFCRRCRLPCRRLAASQAGAGRRRLAARAGLDQRGEARDRRRRQRRDRAAARNPPPPD